jgi:hypothetical protein
VSKRRSRIAIEGIDRTPHRAFWRAMGLGCGSREADRRRDVDAWRDHALLDEPRAAGGRGEVGRARGRRHAARVHDDLRLRRHLDEPSRHALQPDQPRADRGFDRGRDARPRYDALVGFGGCDKTLPGDA